MKICKYLLLPLFIVGSFLLSAYFCEKKLTNFEEKFGNYDKESVVELLGYDPHITLYEATEKVVNADCVTVYVPGWGESQKSIPFFKANSSLLVSTVVGFDFKDAFSNASKILPDVSDISSCQTDDIASLLVTLKTLDECGVPVFHLFGTSRGGGTIITTIARVMDYKKHSSFFKRLHITRCQADRILKKIQLGTIVLNCPFVDITMSVKDFFAPYGASWLSPLITHAIIPYFTSYSPKKDCPLKAACAVQSLNLAMLVHFQKNNLIVGNSADEEFYQTICGQKSYLVVGNDGAGHFHHGESLAPALHAFRKKHGGAYIFDTCLLSEGENMLANSPHDCAAIKDYVDAVYATQYIFEPKKDKKDWQHAFACYDNEQVCERLGYDPVVRIYQADNRSCGAGVTVYVHGYGDNYKFTIPHFQLNSCLLPGPIVGFNFQDVTEGAFKTKISKSSVGQAGDIATLVTVLKMLDECGVDIISLFGYSRGGATTITTLGRLCSYEKYKDFFDNLKVSSAQAARIVEKILCGTIVLNCPLVDTRSVANHWFGKLDRFVMDKVIPSIMEHRPDSDQAIDAACVIKPMNFKILVHFQKDDRVLGNSLTDALFYNNLKGPHTYLVIADEGGHKHTGETLNKAVQSFKKRYNVACFPYQALIDSGNILLEQTPVTDSDVEGYVMQMYT